MCCCKGALFVALRCLPMRRGLACGVGAPDGSLCSGCDLGGWGPGYIMPGSDSPRFAAELARHDMSGTSRVAQRCYPASFFSHVIRHIVLPIPPYVADEPTYARSVHENLQGLEDRTLPWWCSLHQAEAPPSTWPPFFPSFIVRALSVLARRRFGFSEAPESGVRNSGPTSGCCNVL